MGLPFVCHGSAMGLPWVCYGSAIRLRRIVWVCDGSPMGPLWRLPTAMPWACNGHPMGMLYGHATACHGFAICMVLTRHAHPADALRKYAIDVLRGRAHRPRTRHPRRRRCAIDMLCECHGCAICLLLICYGGGRMAYATDMLGA